ncbi:DUF4124 domain-containing protein [Litchfieldella qijiaojingensis]|uniref:DUF4124 domain-containing protein n=1 Tax=Litchfieldella qijiaojingensis TaxID=980347 RepID=UPI00167C4222|nr:DUF4124 domain-containing protein [Halomonas qijiaojingensis]
MRLRLIGLVFGLCLPLAASATPIYRGTDAQGNVIFTDRPLPGAERVELPPVTVVPSRKLQLSEPSREADRDRMRREETAPLPPFMPYTTFRITSPGDGETLPTGYAGNVRVELNIEPELRRDNRVRLLVDDRVSQTARHTSTFMLTNLERGEHELRAELLDTNGEVRHLSAPVTLYVQRASVNLPQNPNNPSHRLSQVSPR